MRLPSILLALATIPAPLVAQDRDLLPMLYVRVDGDVARRLADDWDRLRPKGREWVYCVTAWSRALTQDRDTVFVINALRAVPADGRAHEAMGFACRDGKGAALPLAHAHPSGDCSASRADAAEAVAYDVPFGLVLCGPWSTAGYSRLQFVLMLKGVMYDRSNGMP